MCACKLEAVALHNVSVDGGQEKAQDRPGLWFTSAGRDNVSQMGNMFS